jgi:two-component system, NtrC family, sensor kinase
MDAFVWDARFATGIESVDSQHHHLLDLVNQVGDMLLENRGDEAALQAVFGDLAHYATEHFANEERLMAESGVDLRHSERHTRHHRDFVTQLVGMWDRRAASSDPAALLHGYLTSWLTVHILGEDQVMARMMEDIRQGMSAAHALEREAARTDRRISPLLDALHKLYHVLSVQNRDLAESNQSLEQKVLARTQDLAAANAQLEKDREDLRQALARVETTQQQLLQSEKMASLGRMVAGFAHELNTPVGIAIGAVSNGDSVIARAEQMMAGDEVSADDLLACLNEMREGNALALSNLQRAAELVQRLKRSSIDQEGMVRRAFRLQDVVDDVLLGLKPRLLAADVTVDRDIEAGLLIEGLPGLYEQILTSLVGNALRHGFADSAGGGRITIHASMADASRLRLICRDDGRGMADEVAARVFEPFYTTQRASGRLGLGLYLCYNIVDSKLGGTIACSSSPGGGTAFEVIVPVDRAKVDS